MRSTQSSSSTFKAHKTGCNAVCWAPAEEGADGGAGPMRLLSGGCDNLLKIWKCEGGAAAGGEPVWTEECTLPHLHDDWVRDVAWAPRAGTGLSMAASCGQDKKVVVWTQASAGAEWASKVLQFGCVVWSVSWSVTGSVLAAAGGDNQVTLWKENALGEWKQIGQLSDAGAAES